MKRRNRDDDDIPLPPHGSPPVLSGDALMPCKVCGSPTKRDTLSTYGARCFGCYRDFCERPVPAAAPQRIARRNLDSGPREESK